VAREQSKKRQEREEDSTAAVAADAWRQIVSPTLCGLVDNLCRLLSTSLNYNNDNLCDHSDYNNINKSKQTISLSHLTTAAAAAAVVCLLGLLLILLLSAWPLGG